MKYVMPFMDDLQADEEANVVAVREKLANNRYTSDFEVLEVVDLLYSTIEGLRQHNFELECELKEVYRDAR